MHIIQNAIDLTAAQIKKIDSPVAGMADILVAPDLEAGNMLAKSLTFRAVAARNCAWRPRADHCHQSCRLGDDPAGLLRGRRARRPATAR